MATEEQMKGAVEKYFVAWNAHDKDTIEKLHAPQSVLKDWDNSHGPTNADVATGIAGIWTAVPDIKIEIKNIFTSAKDPTTCIANITVIVDSDTQLDVCDVFEFDAALLVVSLNAYKA